MKLSKRLALIGESIEGIETMADIGTDHGQLPIMLVRSGRCSKAIASDINKGPVEIAINSVGLARLSDKIEVRKGNGLAVLKPGEVQLIVVAGMGGALITEILSASPLICKRMDVKLILQPNTEPWVLREWLLGNGFVITKEELAFDQGKYYEMLWAEYREVPDEKDYPGDFGGLIGGYLIMERHPLAFGYLERKKMEAEDVLAHLEKELEKHSEEKAEHMRDRLAEIKGKIAGLDHLMKELGK